MSTERIILELAEKQAIYELMAHYADRIDANDPAGAAACFAEDGLGVYWQDCIGPKAIEERLIGILDRFHATSHHLSNVQIKLTGETTATAQAYVYAFHRVKADMENPMHYWGRWVDELKKVGGEWKFKRREVVGIGSIARGSDDLDHPGHPGRLSREAAKADFG
jgi:ketosteroid isomerase-like protein